MRALLALILLSYAADLISGQTIQPPSSTKKWFVKPYKGAYAKGDVAFQSNKGRNGEATANKAALKSSVEVQDKGTLTAGKAKPQVAQAKSAKGITATGDQSKKNPSDGLRTGDAGKWHGEMKNKKSGNDQQWNPSLPQQGKKIDSVMHGKGDSFDAAGSKGNKYNVDPDPGQTKTAGSGVITRNGEKYNYKDAKTANGDAQASMTNVGKGSNRKTYTCTGQKVGVSNCVDQNGLKYGEVVEQPDGTVIVKKTIAKGVDVPVGKAKVIKDENGKRVATVNDGMFTGKAGNTKSRDCMSDYGKSASKIKVEKPLTVKYSSESKDGKKSFQFPDCVLVGAKITLPPGMDVNRLATQFDVSILPAGKLKCVDPGSCNKDCYYCNFCNNTRKAEVMSNNNGQQLCNTKGGGTYQLSTTLCPPPESFDKNMCTGFTKYDANYYKKKGDIQARILFYERPANEVELKAKYYNSVNGNSIAKQLLKTQFAIDNKNLINANNPTDFDLAEYYIKKNAKPGEELVGCIEGTTNYTLSSQKVNTGFLLEAGSIAAAPKSLFDNKQCPGVDKVNQEQAQLDAAAAKKTAPKSAWGNFGNVFQGGR